MAAPDTHPPKVLISYSHDSPDHADRVRSLSDRLRAEGIDSILDQYEMSPPEGWPLWTERQIRDADFVLMICTETYRRRVIGDEKPGTGLGVRWEGHVVYQQMYNAGVINAKFIPVLLESGQPEHIPTPLQGVAHYFAHTEEGYEDLYRRLTNQPRHLKPALGQVRKLQPLEPKERKQDFFTANLPFERNPFFTGREKILEDLHSALAKKGATALAQAISGLGGLGKTQTAIEYAYRYRDDYTYVFWVRADSRLALSTGFVEIARLLDLPEKDAQSADDAVRAVRQWLESKPGWLLIFDNADEPELLKEFRPRNAKGHVLLTSRAQVFDALGIARPIEIEAMSPAEALKFFFTRTGRDDDNAAERGAAAQLAEELGCLPLALEQAGAFVTAKKARFQDYLASYRKRRLKLLKEFGPVAGDYPESVVTTWAINFQEVEEVSPEASDLLRVSAFLSPDRIPLELITKGAENLSTDLSVALCDVEDDPLALNEVLEPLTRYSFIRLDSDSQTYSIHRLVQEVLRDGMDADTQRRWAESIVLTLCEVFPPVEFKNWPLCRRLLPQVKAAAGLIEKWDHTSGAAALLLNNAALYCHHRGQYADAEPLFERALTILEKMLGPNHPSVATSLETLAGLYRFQGRHAEAEPLYERALAILEKALEPDHPNVARNLHNLAALYYAQDRYEKAELLYKRALTIGENVLGPDHPDIAQNCNNLGTLYYAQGKYSEAAPMYERALAIREKVLEPDHPDMAQSFNSLAALYYAQGKHAEAESLLERALAILEKSLEPDHPSIVTVLVNYAVLLRETGRETEAAEMEARVEAIRAKHARQDSAK